MTAVKFNFFVCEFYEKEARNIVSAEKLLDVNIQVVPAICKRCVCNTPEHARTAIPDQLCIRGDSFNLLYTSKMGMCQSLLAGSSYIENEIAKGNYVLSSGWLINWKRTVINEWGFDEIVAKDFFKESANKLLLLDSGIYDHIEQELQLFSSFSGLEYEIIPVGMEYFHKNFMLAYQQWKLKSSELLLQEKSRQLADYTMTFDMFPQFSELVSTDSVIQHAFLMFMTLTAASKMAFIPLHDSASSQDIVFHGAAYESELLNVDIQKTEENITPTKLDTGFILKITASNRLLGLIEVTGIPFANHFKHYSDLAVYVGQMYALALSNAIHFEELSQQSSILKKRTVELESALSEINSLRGIIPICSYCKKIRDDQSSWHKLETYITKHSDAVFSHGVCPHCMEEQVAIITKDNARRQGQLEQQ